MRNSRSGSTPKASTVQDESITNNAEKSSAKKLRQARLPFKIIAPATSPAESKSSGSPTVSDKDKDAIKETQNTEGRKRKLSYDDAKDDGMNPTSLKDDDNVSKENVETLAAAAIKKKKLCTNTVTDVVSLVDEDDDDDIESSRATATPALDSKKESELKTQKSASKDKKKGAGTPKTASAQKEKNGSATKLTIKLPLSAGKKKRRKSSVKNAETEKSSNNSAQELSSDDIEEIAAELNPQKRKKLNDTDKEAETPEKQCVSNVRDKQIETVVLDTEPEVGEKKVKKTLQTSESLIGKDDEKIEEKTKQFFSKRIAKSSEKPSADSAKTTVLEQPADHENIEISDSSDGNEQEKDEKENHEQTVLNDDDNEADDERDSLARKPEKNSSDLDEKSKLQNIEQTQKDGKNTDVSAKTFTPKQVKLMEQRRKVREEKERKLQEEKLKKQQEKEEKELARKREREEREEQKRKEREEKEEQKRKEREEKERKRLAEVEAKNEEKRKKNEAKEEELRKKEEERKRKEQEKEEAELKKKKAAQAFTKFFVAKTPSNTQLKNEEDSNTGDGNKLLAFRPFQIKGDMKLAPITRKNFTTEAKNRLDELLGCKTKTDDDDEIVRRKPLTKSQLYLAELHSGKILPGRWRRPSTESKDDVILVEDELERVGQEIVEEVPAYVREEMRVKFYKFHDNRRPPYYGTWRKKSSVVKPRKPFAQDKKLFDYEVDSDDEWEEEEPGESLEDGSDEDKEKESEDDDYEVDNEWFVPHGHLSEEEMQNEDEFGLGDDNTREAQKAKLQLLQQEFAQEMKKKTEKIKPRLIGCIWADINGNRPADCATILWDTLEKKAMLFVEPPLTEEPEVDRSSEINSPSAASNGNAEKTTEKIKPINLSDNMIKDLTRLVHGNNHAKNFLINEYIAYVEKTEESVKTGDLRKPLKSVVRDKIDEIAEWQVVVANASSIQEMEKVNEETNDKKKKKVKRRLCWVVKQEMLDKMDLSSLELHNSWQYTLPPKFVKAEKELKIDETATKSAVESSTTSRDSSVQEKEPTLKEEPTKTLPTPSSTKTTSTEASSNGKKSNTAATPKAKKRVPLLMSVARGQQISTPAKNKLISQFLQQKNKDNVKTPASPMSTKARSTAVTSPNIEDDDVVILD